MENIVYVGSMKPPYAPGFVTLEPTGFGPKLKKMGGTLLGAIIVMAVIGAIAGGLEWNWLGIVGFGIGLLIIVYGFIAAAKSRQAPCPYCSTILGRTMNLDLSRKDENLKIECTGCGEWLISSHGELRAFRKEDITDEVVFPSPAFVGSAWPGECITCGAPATKHPDLSKFKFHAGKLLAGKISWSTGSMGSVPYCDKHSDDLQLDIEGGELRLIFKDYDARRRYLSVNRNKQKVRSK
jgi:hypothetical protein